MPGERQPVALGDRKVELLREVDEELPARARAAGLDEAEMPRRYVRVERELELAEAPARAPETHQLAGRPRLVLDHGHARNVAELRRERRYTRGNRREAGRPRVDYHACN